MFIIKDKYFYIWKLVINIDLIKFIYFVPASIEVKITLVNIVNKNFFKVK